MARPARKKDNPSPDAGPGVDPRVDPEGDRPFEALLAEAAELADRLESRDLPLEDALAAYAQGVRRLRACAARLADVEERARVLVADGRAWRLDALDADEGDDGDGATAFDEDDTDDDDD